MKKLISALLAAAICVFAGCAPEKPRDSWSVWSTYNTTKVIRQTSRNISYEKLPAQLSAQMMLGEYEGAQLIVTPEQDTTYLLTPGALTNAQGDAFPQENIQIYHQKYQTIKTNFNGDPAFQAGDSIPDMLLPLSIAAQYGENVIPAGHNQGITVEFCSENTAPGLYTGTFTLELNGEKMPIPVSVEVWDIAYEGRREFQSCFVLYRDELFVSEYRCDDALVDTYIDKLLSYKVNTYVMQSITPEAWVAQQTQLFENEHYNSIPIPYRFPWDYQTYQDGVATQAALDAVSYIKALAKASTGAHNYLEYAYFYPGFLDEADLSQNSQAAAEAFLRSGGDYEQLLQLAVSQIQAEGWLTQTLEESILQLPAVLTNVNYVPQWVGTLDTVFCPYLSVYNDTATLNRYQEAAAQHSNGDFWLYTCYGPGDPYPTFHIDDGTLDKRVCGWMLKACDVAGYLYYKVNNYAYLHSAPTEEYIDVYATPARYYDVNGDGFLLYPGRYYGSSEPFGTVRLAAYRDGMDEYDMLCIYEKLLKDYAREQGIPDFSFTPYVEDLYRSLFTGMVARGDASALYKARQTLAQRILALQNGTLLYDPLKAEQTLLLAEEKVVIQAEYKDKGEEIGSKTKLHRPYYAIGIDALSGAKTLCFTYENTGSVDLEMQIVLVAGTDKITLDTSYCGAGKVRQVRIALPAGDGPAELQLTFDNVQVNAAGQTVLMPQRSFTLSNVALIQ